MDYQPAERLLCAANHIPNQIFDAIREVFHHDQKLYFEARK
jgi:hypothetical protein